ncbi:MAG: hypothetical protein HQ534_05860 [Armatimonadetes bacterium]|nr:hypothetical protein [Armatimonadota bacterium]
MIKEFTKRFLSRFGYEIRKIPNRIERPGFTLYRFIKKDGTFDYEKYKQIQIDGNKSKIDWVWAVEENIAFLSDYIKKISGQPKFGICHGTRNGKEQEWFRKYLHCNVIGTEISDTAEHFPHTIQWDFHETKPEWINATDFIYSNSFDHSYNPHKCLNAWINCLKTGGLCIIEHTSNNEPSMATELDPFGADLVQILYLITRWGEGKYCVRELLEVPVKKNLLDNVGYAYFIAVQKL